MTTKADLASEVQRMIDDDYLPHYHHIFRKFIAVIDSYDGPSEESVVNLWTKVVDWARERELLLPHEAGTLSMLMK